MHLNSKLLFEKYAKPYFKNNMRVLEIGPTGYPSAYNKMVGNNTITWETLDISGGKNLSYVPENEYEFPVPDGTFDIVLSGQVIEHVKKVWVWVKELARACKTGGHVITIAPVSWPFHEHPVDCWRIYPEGMKVLYEEAGLKMRLCESGTLETRRKRFITPGEGARIRRRELIALSIKNAIHWPTTCSFDTIAIGVKA
jgi:SAM-dependent methyltransferase